MSTLFDVFPTLPEGFSYTPEFLTRQEENEVLKIISGIELHTFHRKISRKGAKEAKAQRKLMQN